MPGPRVGQHRLVAAHLPTHLHLVVESGTLHTGHRSDGGFTVIVTAELPLPEGAP